MILFNKTVKYDVIRGLLVESLTLPVVAGVHKLQLQLRQGTDARDWRRCKVKQQ